MATKRVFDDMSLNENEKRVAKKVSKLHKFTDHWPSDLEVYQMRAFTAGVGIIDLLMESGQFDVIIFILSLLTAREMVRLAAATSPTFVEWYWAQGSKMLKAFSGYFLLKSHFHAEPKEDRLLSLTTGKQILREFNLFRLPKLKHRLDDSRYLCSMNVSTALFNPKHPLVAVVTTYSARAYILAYGGEERRQRGQILYVLTLEYPNTRFRSLNWSPSGNYLLALEEDRHQTFKSLPDNKIRIFYYNSSTFSFNEINFAPHDALLTFHSMNTKFLWLDDSSFIFSSKKKHLFRKFTLSTDGTFVETPLDLSRTLSKIAQLSVRKNLLSYIGAFFVLPDASSPYLYFLVNCPIDHHQHQRLVYVDKISQDIVKYANLPGEVIEIFARPEKFFLLLQNRPYEDYKANSAVLWNFSTEEEYKKCFFSEPWRSKTETSQEGTLFSPSSLFCGDNTEVKIFRSPCCSEINTPNILLQDSNKKPDQLTEYLTKVNKADNLFATNDYVYYVSRVQGVTRVKGLHHHFDFPTCMKDEYVFPPSNFCVWFHPEKPIFLRRKKDFAFDICLAPWADDDDIDTYPEIASDDELTGRDYTTKVKFRSSSAAPPEK